jgi:outer membrane protein OmpA-like peptidoglycan-associated protein
MRLRVLEPCLESWEGMARAGAVRRCEACRADVHDLRGLTEGEALRRVVLRGSAVCVRVRSDASGVAIFARVVARRRASRVPSLLAGALGAAVAACGAPPAANHVPTRIAASDADAGLAVSADAGVVERDGAGDGIPDRLDACPTIAGPADSDERHNGCPRVVIVESMGMVILPQIHFAVRASALVPESFPVIDAATDALAHNPDIAQVEVEGHASKDEPNATKLSEERARAVVARMVERGVDPKRLVARGRGITQPLEDNATAEGRAKNRRVSFHVVEATPDSCPSPRP